MISRKTLPVVLIATVALAFAARPASADAIYNITDGNAALTSYMPVVFAQAQVKLIDSTHAQVTFLSNFLAGFYFGGTQSADVNVNGTFTPSAIATCLGGGATRAT